MKFIGLLIIFLVGVQIQVWSQHVEALSVCSGETVELKVTDIFEGSNFAWSVLSEEIYEELAGESNAISVNFITDKLVTKNYKCIYYWDNLPYDTTFFSVDFYPLSTAEITGVNLCQGEIASFTYFSDSEIENQTWYVNGKIISYGRKLEYLCETDESLNISLAIVNNGGCETRYDTLLNVGTDFGGTINKIPQASEKYFIEDIECGNSVSVYRVQNLDESNNVISWEIVSNDEVLLRIESNESNPQMENSQVLSFQQIESNSITIKWLESNKTRNIQIKAIYSNGMCEYETTTNSILLDDNSPGEGIVFQKPNNSSVLIFPDGQYVGNMNYLWGYNDIDGNTVEMNENRFFCDFDELDQNNSYWVETWFGNIKSCRTRNYLGILQSGSTSAKLDCNIYPNPATNSVTIQIPDEFIGIVTISDLMGIVVKTHNVNKNENEIKLNLIDLIPGNYLVNFNSETGRFSQSKNLVVK